MIKKIVLGAFLCLPSVIFAQGFQVNLQGQKQTGMAGAGAGLLLDEAAIYYNPGAVSMLNQNGVIAGVSPVFFKSAFQQAGSNLTENNKNEVAPPFQVYGLWGPKSGRYKLGLGVYTPFGGLNNWGDDWSGKYTITLLDLKTISIQPTVSVKLTENIGIGAGLVFSHGSVDLRKRLPFANNDGQPGLAQLKGSDNALGWNAGLYINTDMGLSFGLTYHSKVLTKVEEGDAIFDVSSALKPNFPTKFSAELPLAATLTAGVGYKIDEKTALVFDFSWTDWTVYKSLDFIYNNNALVPNSSSPRNYEAGYALKLGGQRQVSEKFTARAGIGYVLTPVEDGYVTPEVPDANRLVLSAGASYKINNKFSIDGSFVFEGFKERFETNIETQLSGKYKSNVYVPGVSINYKF